MAFPDNNDPFRKTSNTRRFSRTTVWAVAGAVVLVLFGILFIIPGRNMRDKSAESSAGSYRTALSAAEMSSGDRAANGPLNFASARAFARRAN